MEFNTLLDSVGKILQIPLKADENQCCMIEFYKENIILQIELEQGTDNLIIAGNIAKIPPGMYKQNLFEQALKANNLDFPRGGILAFSPKIEQLVLFIKVPAINITPNHVVGVLNGFKEKFLRWKEAIEKNETPQLVGYFPTKGTSSGMFGLR